MPDAFTVTTSIRSAHLLHILNVAVIALVAVIVVAAELFYMLRLWLAC